MNTNTIGRTKRTLLSLGLFSSLTLLAGCDIESDDTTELLVPKSAVIQTVAPDYSSSEVAYLDSETQTVSDSFYIKDQSDYTISSFGSDVYHIGRGSISTVEKYNSEVPAENIFDFTTQDVDEVAASNPYTMVFASDTKAYLIRYGSDKVWIVNPSATLEEDFKIGELDLSSYIPEGNTNGTPRPADGVIVNNQLYITMQRLSDDWSTNTAYVAVFDVETDTEIETNSNSEDSVKGIELAGENPLEHSIKAAFGDVYVTSRSAYSNFDLSLSMIEKIETSDFSVSTVLSAADIVDNQAAFISTSEIVSTTKGYFVASKAGYNEDGDWVTTSAIYQFNPTTGSIDEANVAGTGSEEIAFISVDDSNFLWMSVRNASTPGVDIINTEDNSFEGSRLLTDLNPGTIRFLD